MPVAERTYRGWTRAQPSQRDIDDAHLIEAIRVARVGDKGEPTPESLYGRRKMTALLRRHGMTVSSSRVDRLMRQLGINGLVRGKGARTTVPDPAATRAPDLLDRDFTAAAPNTRWVADFTYVRTWAGFGYVAFVIDCFSRAIVGWHAATTKATPLVTTALRMALWRRDRAGHRVGDGLVDHSDAGAQFRSRAMARELRRHDMVGSMGRVGAAGDNAAMESFWSLLQTNVLNQQRWATRQELRLAIVVWIERKYHRQRAQDTLGGLTPIEFEAKLTEPLTLAA
ncbi:IS3 family transposase [Microcella alkaliphila]|uniref:Transposase IS401 n=1 Tax=Microcella alkaliphila TaxID=279828 RepID=A0A0U5BLE5_9MICO|nr:IS3 family transposase [Microcella alkaliphila]BAU31675.1 transposase IS401 [Microcella alkaliphila]